MVGNAIQVINACLLGMSNIYDSVVLQIFWHPLNWLIFAQTLKDPDLLGSWQRAFDHFVQSGQAWALLIGLVLGYVLRGLTTYG